MSINVLVNGAFGKMGCEVVQAIKSEKEFTLVGEAGKQDNLADKIKHSKAQIVIDFTIPQAAYSNAKTIIEANVHPVVGTTGFTEAQIKELQTLCAQKKLGGIIASNFSIGAVLMMEFAQKAARYFDHIEIIEMHHTKKIDAPSGTALRTAELINKKNSVASELLSSRGQLHHNIPIHSLRIPGIVASQEVIFGSEGETLSIKDNVIDRKAYMLGVILACKKVISLDHLKLGINDLIFS